MPEHPAARPSWDRLFEIAVAQDGLFTTQQAADAGYSPQLIAHHLRSRRMLRVHRGIYRLVHFPAGQRDELVIAWLWSDRAGIFSHETALSLHGLSDVLPAHLHLTLPDEWRRRRFRTPSGVTLHHADIAPADRAWYGSVLITNPRRSLNDSARAGLSPELLQQATQQALRRGLVDKAELGDVETALSPFGGIAT
jgi:predicted transcriptional regulator of viral defense system